MSAQQAHDDAGQHARESTGHQVNEEAAPKVKPVAERWFEEQQAWQQTMRDYADSMVKDEQFLMHLGNAMRGSLLAGAPYPTPQAPGAPVPGAESLSTSADTLAEILFSVKLIDGRLRNIEAALDGLGVAAETSPDEER